MSTIVRLGPEYFPDPTKGKPVSNGSIYIGLPDLDPEIIANQITVTAVQEGTDYSISQPIYTGAGGLPLYNGSAATLTVEESYSLKVLDSSGAQVYYVANSFAQDIGTEILYLSNFSCDLASAISSIGSTIATLIVDCDSIIASGTTVVIPDTLLLSPIKGGSIDGVSGGGTETLTFSGLDPSAGRYQIFGSDLTVTGIKTSLPEWWGATGDGVTDDTQAFVSAAESGGFVYVGEPFASYVTLFDATDALVILDALKNFKSDAPLTLYFDTIDIDADTVEVNITGGSNIFLEGAALTEYTGPGASPNVTVDNISGNRNDYLCRYALTAGNTGLSIGDWVRVTTEGRTLTVADSDETANGSRRTEIDGFWQVTALPTDSVTFRVKSRQSAANFPGGGTISASTALCTSITIEKFNTVLNFTDVDGFDFQSDLGGIENIGIIGNNGGSSTSGMRIDSITTDKNQKKMVGAAGIGIANFSGAGINVQGYNSSFSGYNIASTGNGTHGIRVKAANAVFDSSVSSGNGDSAGNGFFATHAASISCPDSIAAGNRNTGFIANRVSTLSCDDSISINNGNYQDEVDGGFTANEGKGFESEAGSIFNCNTCVAIYNTYSGFYSLAGSKTYCHDSIGSAHLIGKGFYATTGSTQAARRCVAKNNIEQGFYALSGSKITADDSESSGNTEEDYKVSVGSTITADDAVGIATATTNVPINVGGPNQIISSNTAEIGSNGILVRGANLEILSGEITITHPNHRVDVEGGVAVLDFVHTINGGLDGQMLTLRQVASGRDITFRHETGNISLAGAADKTLAALTDRTLLQYDEGLTLWIELVFKTT